MTIKINKEDFGALCICALRYCHGRRTYMPSLIQRVVRSHFKDLLETDLEVMANDEDLQTRFDLWGDECDKRDWQNFYQALREFRERSRR